MGWQKVRYVTALTTLGAAEMGIYSVLAVLLSATILAAIASACKLLSTANSLDGGPRRHCGS